MALVLVVDDSAADRHLAGEFLAEDSNLELDYAADGAEALAQMERCAPDLVLTDLRMPKIDGLELVATAKSRYPLVPVIIMTSRGSEETAVRALRQGAASYVPKSMLARDLLETVRSVLAVSSRNRAHKRLMGCMTESHYSFVLANDCSLFHPLTTYLQEGISHMGLCGDVDLTRVGVALEEALANAFLHGNLEIDSELRGKDGEEYQALIQRRISQLPYRDRRIYVRAELSPDEAVFVVADEGSGFDYSAVPDPTEPANLEKASGRGILLMRTFMDDLVFNETGNTVTLVKRRNLEPGEVIEENA
jgi:DNA-binding response OmpR family regulator